MTTPGASSPDKARSGYLVAAQRIASHAGTSYALTMTAATRLWPREHGAYAQLALPLATALALGEPELVGVCITAAAIAGFLVHEPLLVLLGHRGWKRQQALRGPATRRLAALFAVAATVGLLGLIFSDQATRLSLVLPAASIGVVALLIAKNREKTLTGELVVGLTFALVAVPVALAGGISWALAALAAAVWSLLFALGTLAVHALLSASRGFERTAVRLSGGFAVAMMLLGTVLSLYGQLWSVALFPPAVVSAAVVFCRVPATQLRRVGWALAAAYLLSFAALVTGFQQFSAPVGW